MSQCPSPSDLFVHITLPASQLSISLPPHVGGGGTHPLDSAFSCVDHGTPGDSLAFENSTLLQTLRSPPTAFDHLETNKQVSEMFGYPLIKFIKEQWNSY